MKFVTANICPNEKLEVGCQANAFRQLNSSETKLISRSFPDGSKCKCPGMGESWGYEGHAPESLNICIYIYIHIYTYNKKHLHVYMYMYICSLCGGC